MDLRLPMAGSTPPTAPPPWPSDAVTRAVSPPSEDAPDEHGADETEDDHDRPARRRRSSQRRATEAFAEALARAEDPTRSELPGASDVATALAALREEPAHVAGSAATEAVLPRELPAADLMPRADEEREPEAVAAESESVAVEQPEPEPEVEAAEPEPVAVEQPEPEPEAVAAEPEPVAIEQLESEPEVEAAELEPVAVEQPEQDAEVTSAPDIAPIGGRETAPSPPVEPRAGVDAAMPVAEAPPISEADDQPEREEVPAAADVPVAAEPERDADQADVEAGTKVASIGEGPESEEVAMDLEPVAAVSVDAIPVPAPDPSTTVRVDTATGEPQIVEPIAWDRERYTVDIDEPDWFAGEEPQAGDQSMRPQEVPAAEDEVPDAPVADPATARPDAPSPVPEPAPPPSGAHRDEETMLWFGRQPPAPAAEPAGESSAGDDGADDGASEMEVAGSGRRAQMPGGHELDEALAALNALSRERVEPVSTVTADEPVEETDPADAWPRSDTSAWTPPPASSGTHAAPTPASRAYRRLRRIFPG
jgi:hypothetical protein